ncbi:MAG: hypothetical protein M3M94_02955 [Actinomycetota bacterium]|nr:hypothetical protein [Actinomycetota bacterium]
MSTTEPEGAGGGSIGGASMGTGGGQTGGGEARDQARTLLGGMTTGSSGGLARLPIPGNAEFAFLVLLEAFLAILLLDDAWNTNDWAFASVVVGAAYLISRGIAKASRVLEQ